MNDKQLVGVVLLFGVAAWWLMRNRGGSALPAAGAGISPQQASTAGGVTGVGTNPFALVSTIGADIAKIFSAVTSRPGNVTASPRQPASPPTSGPTTYGGNLPPQAPLSPYPVNAPLPQITDPNQPWLSSALGLVDQLPDFASHADVLSWTLDPTSLGFDPNAIATPGGGMSYPDSYPRISVVGVE